jgi:hypothetical protein
MFVKRSIFAAIAVLVTVAPAGAQSILAGTQAASASTSASSAQAQAAPKASGVPTAAKAAASAAPATPSKSITVPVAPASTAAKAAVPAIASKPVTPPSAAQPAAAVAPKPAAAVVAAAPASTATGPIAGPLSSRAGGVTISELAAMQGRAIADEAMKKTNPGMLLAAAPVAQPGVMVVPELRPTAAIPVVMEKDKKPSESVKKTPPPPPPRPYLASIIGMKGMEIAEIHTGDRGYTIKAGDSIGPWLVVRVNDGALLLTSQSSAPAAPVSKSKKAKRTAQPSLAPRSRVLAVGEFL